MTGTNPTRREVLRASAAIGAVGLGATGTAVAAPGKGDEQGNGKIFGRVWANDVLYRTNVVKVLDDEPQASDVIYFVNDGTTASLPPNGGVNGGGSPFVSESAPGDRDWNGGQWVHYSAQLADGVTLSEPLTSESDVLAAEEAGQLTISKGRPDIAGAPPNFFVCPLNGRA
ncbi:MULTISPECIES: hypothetical protein [Salinibaculum]|uniref:hypothetical protein n=1 Tax=Salinibaculum TaxID=2732368 RepID=UPI0030CA60B0